MKITATLTEHEIQNAVAEYVRRKEPAIPKHVCIKVEISIGSPPSASASWDPDQREPIDER